MNRQINVDNDKMIEEENEKKKIVDPACSYDEEQNKNEHKKNNK